MFFFIPVLARCRREGLKLYGGLVNQYNRQFHEKWIKGNVPEGETLLGSADIQSLADLGNSFEMVREMRIVPFNPRVILQVAVVSALPALPLVLLVIPVDEILKLIAGTLL